MSYDELVAVAQQNYEVARFYQQRVTDLVLLSIGLVVLVAVLAGCLVYQVARRRRIEAAATRQEALTWTVCEIERIGASGRSAAQRIAEDTVAQLDLAARRMAS